MSKIVLPAKYYLYHFEDFIATVETQLSSLLEDEHRKFLEDYALLSEDARCLLIRMLNRKGEFFTLQDLPYAEIEDIGNGWQELQRANFIRPLCPDDLGPYCDGFTKPQLLDLCTRLDLPVKKSGSRVSLRTELRGSESRLWELLPERIDVGVLLRRQVVEYLYFLYFGKLQDKLVLPTLRDLGIRRSNKAASFVSKFESRVEARTHFFYCKAHREQKKCFIQISLEELETWPEPSLLETRMIRETLLLAQAQLQKSQGSLSETLQILRLCTTHPATEKRARLLFELGEHDECHGELQRMLDEPNCDEELLFAEDFLERKFQQKRLSRLTETLRSAEKLGIDESYFRHPELGVIAQLKAQGAQAYFSENSLWTTLFWSIFEEELTTSRHSEFDHAPVDLKEKTFFRKHQESINTKLAALTQDHLLELFADDEMLRAFSGAANLEGIKSILIYLAQDYYGRCSGFPDLLVLRDNTPSFIEVKAPGDSLKASQLKQLRQLERAGFSVQILQVEYLYNEEQEYVVVDLETTGGNTPWNRITEIGAVKVRGGKIVDTFQSLVNPRRSIPLQIQQLTGITNEMVRSAPPFEAVAPAFLEFSGSAIFVAHNVGFDYGFLQSEFQRLEERYVRPFICTKASIKKHFPGFPSYGLKALCQQFSISLESHHRALSDARAAAELLLLVNQRRGRKET